MAANTLIIKENYSQAHKYQRIPPPAHLWEGELEGEG